MAIADTTETAIDPYTRYDNTDGRMREACAVRSAAWYAARGSRALAAEAVAAVMAAQPDGDGWHHWWIAYVSVIPKSGRA